MKIAFQILLLLLSLNCRAAIVPILRTVWTTNTFDGPTAGGAIPYFDYASGKFVGTGLSYTNAIVFEPTVGFLSIFHKNSIGNLMFNLQESGPVGASIQAFSDRFEVANTNLSFDVASPFTLQWRVDGSNVLQGVPGGVSINAKTNVVSDNGTALTFNGARLQSLQDIYNGGLYGFSTTSIMPTNITQYGLATNITDLFTVPAGKRFVIDSFVPYSTNTSTTTVHVLLKTNGNYYRFSVNATMSATQTSPIVNTGDDFYFEAGETIAIHTTLIGVNLNLSGFLIPTNLLVYSPRLLSFNSGDNVVYTCPNGKCVIAGSIPNLANAFRLSLLGANINNTGGSITNSLYVVRFGGTPDSSNIQYRRSISDKSVNTFLVPVLFPGDSVVINTVITSSNQWARLTVTEIPFP